MPDIALCEFQISSHLTFTETLWGRDHAELTNEDPEALKRRHNYLKVHPVSKWKIGYKTRRWDFRTPDFTVTLPWMNKYISDATRHQTCLTEKWLNWVPFPSALWGFLIALTFQTGGTTHWKQSIKWKLRWNLISLTIFISYQAFAGIRVFYFRIKLTYYKYQQ